MSKLTIITAAKHKFVVTPTGLKIHGEPTFGEWKAFGTRLRHIARVVHFAVGDWLRYGKAHYERGKYDEVMQATGFMKQTLANDE